MRLRARTVVPWLLVSILASSATGAQAVYEERVRGTLSPPQLASKFFQKPDTTVWTFGRPASEHPDPNLMLRARDGRCIERMLDATGANNVSRFGIHWMKRRTGAAMGKSESPLKAEIVFGDEEKRRLARTPALRKEGFLQEGETVDEVVAGLRYVDDLVLFSKLLCVG